MPTHLELRLRENNIFLVFKLIFISDKNKGQILKVNQGNSSPNKIIKYAHVMKTRYLNIFQPALPTSKVKNVLEISEECRLGLKL